MAAALSLRRVNGWRVLCHCSAALVYLFLLAPIIAILPISFSSGSFLNYPIPSFSFRWYVELVENYKWVLAIQNSLIIATCTAILSTVLGLLASVALNRPSFPFKGFATGVFFSPIVVPLVIIAVAVFFFYSDLGLTSSLTGLVLAHTCIGTPYVIITVSAALQNFDTNLIRAAKSLGASPFFAFRKVMLPLIRPGLAAGALFAFVASFDEVIIAIFLAGPEQVTLPRQLFDGLRDELNPVIVAAATVMLVVSLVLMTGVEMIRRRSNRIRGISEE